jgi:glycosyltransferase involved in cell wall biosynthesis
MISIILPVYNEGANIRTAVQSLLAQRGVDIEILVIDGCSTDDSQAIVNEMTTLDARVRLLINEKKETPFAFNIGLRESKGEYIGIFGAHCEYEPDYAVTCLRELLEHGAAGCSGRVITRRANRSLGATISAWVMSNPFAVSGSSFRTQSEGYVDTIPYPVFRKEVIVRLGGYNEQLIRNQDNDMNFRIRQAGSKLYCTHETSCTYYARPTLSGLMTYAGQNGSWCGVSARLEPRSLSLRHYVPLIFALTLSVGSILAVVGSAFSLPLILTLGLIALAMIPLHLFVGLATSLKSLRKDGSLLLTLSVPIIILVFHFWYGLAFLIGLFKPPTEMREALAA